MTRGSLDNINCWEDFKSFVEAMPNTKNMGDAFEQLTKLYFLIRVFSPGLNEEDMPMNLP